MLKNRIKDNPLMEKYDTIEHIEGEEKYVLFFSFDKEKWFQERYFQNEDIPYIKYQGISFLGVNLLKVTTRKTKLCFG